MSKQGLRILAFIVALFGLGSLTTFPLTWEDQAILGVVLFLTAAFISWRSKSRLATLALVALSLFITTRYLYWRVAETYSYLSFHYSEQGVFDLIAGALLLLAEGYAFVTLVLGYFQSLQPLHRKPVPMPEDVSQWPTVDVLIPTYNEPLGIIRSTVLGALNLDWPREKVRVYVLDDGKRDEVRDFARRCGAGYITRASNEHAKAGNINNALRQTSGEFVAIFDCDHVPVRSFLQLTMGQFSADPRMALVQTPHHFYSADPVEHNLDVFRKIPNEGALFYGVIQDGNDFWNAAYFCGSCAVIRRTALEEIGGIAVETVTEDAHTSLRMQKRGWNSSYINIPQAAGLATLTIRDHITQRTRWARGMVQILRLENPLFSSGLTVSQRLCYFNAAIHFLHAGPRLIFLTAPLAYLLLGLTNLYGHVAAILAYAMPHLFIAILVNSRIQGRYRKPFFAEVYETVLSPYILLPTLFALISPYKAPFNVTPKSRQNRGERFDWLAAAPFVVLAGLNMTAIAIGGHHIWMEGWEAGTMFVNVLWASYSLLIVGVVLAAAWETREYRQTARLNVSLPAKLTLADGRAFESRTRDISLGGVALDGLPVMELSRGEEAQVGFRIFNEERAFPVRVVMSKGQTAAFRFSALSIAQEAALVKIIFGRADAWMRWDESFLQFTNPLRSLAMIFRLSLLGFWRLFKGIFISLGLHRPARQREPQRQPALPSIIVLALALSGGLVTARAQSQEASSAAAPHFSDKVDFGQLGMRQPIVLQGNEAEGAMRFWIPATKVVNSAVLTLRHESSPRLSPGARVRVVLNGVEVGSFPVVGASAAEDVATIPDDLLVSENEFVFVLEDACGPDCDDRAAAQVWVRVEPTSELQMEGGRLSVADDLRLLPSPFLDLSIDYAPPVSVVVPPGAKVGVIEAAGVVASWLGALSDHRGVHFSASRDEIPAGNALVFTTFDSSLARQLGLADGSGATVAMHENPNDPYGKVLAFLGANEQEIIAAAQAVALGEFSRQGAQASINSLEIPPARGPSDAPRWLNAEAPILLGDFADAADLKIYANSASDLYFRLPPDLYFGSRRRLPLHLNFHYGRLPRGVTGTVSVQLNGAYLGERLINPSEDEDAQRETFPLPVEALFSSNTLRISFRLTGEPAEGAADSVYPQLEILGNSEMDLTGFRRFAEMPSLEHFANAGFPFTRRADLSDTVVVLPEQPTPAELSVYLNLLGMFGSRTGYPALRVSVLGPAAALDLDRKDLLVIGGPEDQPLFSQWGDLMDVRIDRVPPRLRALNFWESFRDIRWTGFGRDRHELSDLLATPGSFPLVIQGFAHPKAARRSVISVMIGENSAAATLATTLTKSVAEGQVFGSISVLSGDRFRSFRLRPSSYYVGEPGLQTAMDFWLVHYLWALPFAIILLAAAAAWALRGWLDERVAARVRPEAA